MGYPVCRQTRCLTLFNLFSACMVPNDADKESCVCCETPKPGSTAKKAPSAFDNPSKANAAFAAAPGGGGGFNFGTAGATSPPTGGAGGFTFGGGGGGGTSTAG